MLRDTWLPQAHEAAASSTRPSPSTEVSPPVWAAISTMPAVASASATPCTGRSFSPSASIARPIVKKTWIWITSEASPGAMWPLIARYSRPNWPAPINTP